MSKITKNIIGVMSGTSLDGIDIAYVTITQKDSCDFTIHKAETIPYTEKEREILQKAFHSSAEELQKIDAWYGAFLGETIKNFIEQNHIKNLDFIASHGHTIFHNPEENYTLQIGNGAEITAITGYKTICNFRIQDVALGGQGAPLVPIGDRGLFADYEYCLNIGGFANISFEQENQRMAFDICPANIVLNHYVKKLGFTYDDGGKIASTGKVHQPLLEELNQLSFYKGKKPKSLGFEFVKEVILPIIDKYNLETNDILCTFIEHIAIQVSQKLSSQPKHKMLITGGGAYNQFLIQKIQENTKVQCIIPDSTIIDYKEALIFAFLGFLKDSGQINCLKSVTGACKDHSSGVIYEVM